jgi:hypothetical protein
MNTKDEEMKTQVSFRSGKFPPYDGEQEQINPGLWGRRLVEYLVEKLKASGIEAGEPVAEDWGWLLPIPGGPVPMALCCGHQDGDDDEFLVFTEPSTPVVRKLFRKVDVSEPLGRLVSALEKILASDPGIHDVQWTDVGKKGATG